MKLNLNKSPNSKQKRNNLKNNNEILNQKNNNSRYDSTPIHKKLTNS
jgi:hypothetical protein